MVNISFAECFTGVVLTYGVNECDLKFKCAREVS